jgi:uncharacterized radical SAM superfamily Fe-S cluster-containing enzyme
VCLHIATLSSRDVLEATTGDVERFAYRHVRILVVTLQFVALARFRSSCRIRCRLVIDDHVLAWQRQLDANVHWPAVSPVTVRDFQHDAATDDSRVKRLEPRRARTEI